MHEHDKYDFAQEKRRERAYDAAAIVALVSSVLTSGPFTYALAALGLLCLGFGALTSAQNHAAQREANKPGVSPDADADADRPGVES